MATCNFTCACDKVFRGNFEQAQAAYDAHLSTCAAQAKPRDLACLGCLLGPGFAHAEACKCQRKES